MLFSMQGVPVGDGIQRLEVNDLKPEGYLFKIGQEVEFHGLVDSPQHNGERVVVRAYRPDSPNEYNPSGKAYYLESGTPEGCDYIYESRLRAVN